MKKIYIDPNLTPRALDREWPEHPKFPLTQYTSGYWDDYYKALAQAKKDSVPLELSNQQRDSLGLPCSCECHDPNKTVVHFMACCNPKIQLKPDSFIELDIDLEFVRQRSINEGIWLDDDSNWEVESFNYRTIARLKSKPIDKYASQIVSRNYHDRTTIVYGTNDVVFDIPEVVAQIDKDSERYGHIKHDSGSTIKLWKESCDDFEAGASHQHPIAFEAGKKEGWNEIGNELFAALEKNPDLNVESWIYATLDKKLKNGSGRSE